MSPAVGILRGRGRGGEFVGASWWVPRDEGTLGHTRQNQKRVQSWSTAFALRGMGATGPSLLSRKPALCAGFEDVYL